MGNTVKTPLPLNCPYCDEPAYSKFFSHRVVTPFAIYTTRECPMGHIFYTKEIVPEDQDALEKEIHLIRKRIKQERDKVYRERFKAKHGKKKNNKTV